MSSAPLNWERGISDRILMTWVALALVLSLVYRANAWPFRTIREHINSGFRWEAPSWKEALLTEDPSLYLYKIMHSSQCSGNGSNCDSSELEDDTTITHNPVTIFTTVTESRLNQLQRQCQMWPGALVAALWVPIALPANKGNDRLPARKRNIFTSAPGDATYAQHRAGSHRRRMAHTAFRGQQPWQSISQNGSISKAATAEDGNDLPPQASSTLNAAVSAVLDMMQSLRQPMEGDSILPDEHAGNRLPGCNLTVLVFGQVSDNLDSLSFLFPINALRNHAALLVRTPLAAMVDVDLVLNQGFARSLLLNRSYAERLVQQAAEGNLLIPPAMETKRCAEPQCRDGVLEGLVAARGPRGVMKALFRGGSLDTFHCDRATHYNVDFRRWLRAKKFTSYEVPYAPVSEPWYIGHRALLPWYDVRFKGFGFNKQMQVAYAAGNMGMRLMVLADAWLIHLPHQTTIAARLFSQGGQFNSYVQGSSAQGMSMEEARAHREALLQAASHHSSPGLQLPHDREKQPAAAPSHRTLLTPTSLATAQAQQPWQISASSSTVRLTGRGTAGQLQDLAATAGRAITQSQEVMIDQQQGGQASQLELQAQQLYLHMWKLGHVCMEQSPLPDYTPVLSPSSIRLLRMLPWWTPFSSRWAIGQPSPADLKVDPPALPAYKREELLENKKKLQMCTSLPYNNGKPGGRETHRRRGHSRRGLELTRTSH
ncbi:glycosyl-transferase for dystroglycan-domain-containing protein [Haematococcus lacustris]